MRDISIRIKAKGFSDNLIFEIAIGGLVEHRFEVPFENIQITTAAMCAIGEITPHSTNRSLDYSCREEVKSFGDMLREYHLKWYQLYKEKESTNETGS